MVRRNKHRPEDAQQDLWLVSELYVLLMHPR